MTNMQVQEYCNNINLLIPDSTNRKLALSTIIGVAIGSFLQVGYSNDEVTHHFTNTHIVNVMHTLSYLNEHILIDIEDAKAAARSMHVLRTKILNNHPGDFLAAPEYDFMSVALGASNVLPLDKYNVLREMGTNAIKALTATKLLIARLKDDKLITL